MKLGVVYVDYYIHNVWFYFLSFQGHIDGMLTLGLNHRYKEIDGMLTNGPVQFTHRVHVKYKYANETFHDKLTKWHQRF